MRDFATVKNNKSLADINLAKQFSSGYKTFGVVFNTDYSTGGGIHWFCIFGEHFGDKIQLEYFNSSGKEPLEEIQEWLNTTKHKIEKELNIPVNIKYTVGIEFQDDNHSCGVYCLAYIWCRLEGVPFEWFKDKNFDDDIMHELRKSLFIPND